MDTPSQEPVEPDLDAQLHEHFDPQTAAVYADWLEERGEPRAELIRVGLLGGRREELATPTGTLKIFYRAEAVRHHALINLNWERWCGALPKDAVLDWKLGFPSSAKLTQATVDAVGRPGFRFLKRLDVVSSTLVGLEGLKSLQSLSWKASPGALSLLRSLALPRLAWLTLHLKAPAAEGDFAVLRDAALPALRSFDFHGVPEDEPRLLAAVIGARWGSKTTSVTVPCTTSAMVEALVAGAPSLARFGQLLTVRGPAAFICANRPALRAALPRATLRPEPERWPPDDVFTGGSPSVSDQPRYVPANFRELRPATVTASDGERRTTFGSGRPNRGRKGARFTLCAGCASDDTWELFESLDRRFTDSETTTFTQSEYQCRECGRYTHWEHMHCS